jgi:hypothetical protein
LSIFPIKEFNTWEAMVTKTYLALKTFIHKAYGRCLAAIELCNTLGQNGYGLEQNISTSDNTDDNMVTTVTQSAAAAMTMGSITATTTIVIPPKIAAAINQLLANQTAISSQMAAMSFTPAQTQATQRFMACKPFQVPPIQQLECSNNHSTWVLSTPDAQRDMEVAVKDVDRQDKANKAITRLWTSCIPQGQRR